MKNKWGHVKVGSIYDPYRPLSIGSKEEIMNFNDYQNRAVGFLGDDSKADQLTNGIFGINEEAGECAGLVKKHRHHGRDFIRLDLAKELGDLLFYVSTTADSIGYTLEEIALINIDKLSARYPTGKFTKQDSIERKDEIRLLKFDPEHYPEDREFEDKEY